MVCQPAVRRAAALVQRGFALLALLSLLVSGAFPASAQVGPAGVSDPQELEAFMDGVLDSLLREHHVPGAVVVVVKDGEVLFSKGYGWADLETRTPVDPARTLFRPGSVSKLFVWTAVMQLYEQGRLALDEDINTYLDFEIPAAYPEPVTLRHLMTHTPGFEDRGDGLFKLKAEEVVSLETYLKQNLPARVFPPGTIAAYSNYGTGLAAYIVERIAGLPFHAYAEQYILDPLGMEQSTFVQPLPPGLAGAVASAYNYTQGGYVKGGFEFVVPYPVGGLSAAGLDMAPFMIAHLHEGRFGANQILQPETARQMHARLFTPDPRLNGMAHGFFEAQVNGQRVISHGGDTALFHSGLFLLLEQDTGLYISTNGTSGGSVVQGAWTAFMDRYFPAGPPPDLAPAPDFSTRAGLYTGSYTVSRSSFTTFEKLMQLGAPVAVSVDEQGSVILSAYGQAQQFVEVEPGLLVDRADPDNRMVMKAGSGQVILYPASTPMAFIKSGPAGSLGLHGLILAGGLLLFLGALVGWGVGWVRRQPRPAQAGLLRAVRAAAGLFLLALLIFLVTIMGQFLSMNPAFGVPNAFFGLPGWFNPAAAWLSASVAGLGLALIVLVLVTWARRAGSLGTRLHFTLLAVFAAALLWSLYYWNLLG